MGARAFSHSGFGFGTRGARSICTSSAKAAIAGSIVRDGTLCRPQSVCRKASRSSICLSSSTPLNGGILRRPLTIVLRTCSSVAGMPLGNDCFLNIPTNGGPCRGSCLYALWHTAQFAAKISRPRSSWAVSGRGGFDCLLLHAANPRTRSREAGSRENWKGRLNHLLSASVAFLKSNQQKTEAHKSSEWSFFQLLMRATSTPLRHGPQSKTVSGKLLHRTGS